MKKDMTELEEEWYDLASRLFEELKKSLNYSKEQEKMIKLQDTLIQKYEKMLRIR